MSTFFVTGCATGFGHALARRLLREGNHVVATDPSVRDLPDRLGTSERLLVVPLDVRDAAAVRDAVGRANAFSPVDVLVNNAGYAVFGTQEEADLDAVRAMFEVNVLGLARVTQALLPTLRERSGTVVQLSSVAGRTVFPESGYYAATKHAVEAMTEALFQETCTFGVRVRLVQPGSFATCFLETAARVSRPRDPGSAYGSLFETWDDRKFGPGGLLESPQDPERVVDAILGSLADPRPFLRIPVGSDAERVLAVKDALRPDAWSLMAAERNALTSTWDRGEGEVLTPREVLSSPPEALDATLVAFRHGHLAYWTRSDEGRRALERLRDLAGGS